MWVLAHAVLRRMVRSWKNYAQKNYNHLKSVYENYTSLQFLLLTSNISIHWHCLKTTAILSFFKVVTSQNGLKFLLGSSSLIFSHSIFFHVCLLWIPSSLCSGERVLRLTKKQSSSCRHLSSLYELTNDTLGIGL